MNEAGEDQMHYDLDVLGKKVKVTIRVISKFIPTNSHQFVRFINKDTV